MRYRDCINGIDPGYLYDIPIYNKNNLFGLRKISGNCFVDKMRYCSKNNDLCVQQSSLKCLGPPDGIWNYINLLCCDFIHRWVSGFDLNSRYF